MKWFLLFLLSLSFGSVVQAHPTDICGTISEVTDRLKGQYRELPKYETFTMSGLLLRVYMTEDTSSWTIVYIFPDGTACLGDAGEFWEEVNSLDRISG